MGLAGAVTRAVAEDEAPTLPSYMTATSVFADGGLMHSSPGL